jgi:hypothetical protein
LGLGRELVVAGPEDEPDGKAGEEGEIKGSVAFGVRDTSERPAGFYKGLKLSPEAEGQARPVRIFVNGFTGRSSSSSSPAPARLSSRFH